MHLLLEEMKALTKMQHLEFESVEESLRFVLGDRFDFRRLDKSTLENLKKFKDFYSKLNGILGYQLTILKMLSLEKSGKEEIFKLRSPQPVDLQKMKDLSGGIKLQEKICEVWMVGGFGDRLGLKDNLTPAFLNLFGINLLEWLERDLQAREYLYFKLFKKKLVTPIVIFCSSRNRGLLEQFCKEKEYFGRGRERVIFVEQPLVPCFDKFGKWVFRDGKLLMKPGGHGCIWEALKECYDRILNLGCEKLLIRQINNPILGCDDGIVKFLSLGHKESKEFGFYGTYFAEDMKEGIIVVKEFSDGRSLLSNVEYCDKGNYQIAKSLSNTVSNVNLLLVDICAVKKAVEKEPFPGKLINWKLGSARLETSMQGLSEYVKSSFVSINKRSHSISAIKNAVGDKETLETCAKDILAHGRYLLSKRCGVLLGKRVTFLYHPKLGPTFNLIAQKISGGTISDGGLLYLNLADCYLQNVKVEKSLKITSLGDGSCMLQNVVASNLSINICRGGEIVIRNSRFKEELHINVKENKRVIIDCNKAMEEESAKDSIWKYSFDKQGDINCMLSSGYKKLAAQ